VKGVKAIILDRDGTLNDDPGYVHKIEHFKLYPNTIKALQSLKGFRFFIITNQSGIGRGFFTLEDFKKFNDHLVSALEKGNVRIEKTYVCHHHPDEKCGCRKPNIKFIKEIEKSYDIDLKNSWVIGDHPHDIEMGKNAGCKTVYVLTGHGDKHMKELEIKPDFIAKDLYEASKIILKNER
jgi:D-glycero-D-manno-heptose 1,7-bisphosphate phosphatase